MNEEEILDGYINGTKHGQDNKLRATIGSISAKRSKELSNSIKDLESHLGLSIKNLLVNLTYNVENINNCLSKQVEVLNQGIRKETDKLITSNEILSKSNEKNAEKTHKFTKVNILLTAIIVISGVIGLLNLYLTNQIKSESIKANQISEQPFLNFIDDNKPYKFINSGKGVALNFLLLLWDGSNKQFYITSDGAIGEALGINQTGYIANTELIKISEDQIKKISRLNKLVEKVKLGDNPWFALIYNDIYDREFATVIFGQIGEYKEAVRFLEFDR